MNKEGKGKKINLFYFLKGEILEENFIVKNTKMIILIVILLFIFIGNRYSCIQKMKEINQLQNQLTDLKLELISLSTEVIGQSRQSQIEELLKQNNIELESPTEPYYELKK